MLSGQQPHTADTPLAVAYKHVNEAVPAPSQLVDGIPPALDDLVLRATSRDPDLRPADGGQFLHSLNEMRLSLPPAPPAPAAAAYRTPAIRPSPLRHAWLPERRLPKRGVPERGVPDPPVSTNPPQYHTPGYQDPGYRQSGYHDPGHQPGGWPAQPPPSQYSDDLIPGLPGSGGARRPAVSWPGPPAWARPSPPRAQRPARVRPPQLSPPPDSPPRPARIRARPPSVCTMAGHPGPPTTRWWWLPAGQGLRPGPDGYDGPREPGLQRWLFSRRLYYVLAAWRRCF